MVSAQLFFLPRDAMAGWLGGLTEGMRVMVPVREGNAVVYAEFDPGRPMILDSQTAASPKHVIFPQNEYLLEYRLSRDTDEEGHRAVELHAEYPSQKTLVFGASPCGARGLATLDPVFLEGAVVDPYFKARREASVIATVVCTSPGDACFCHWVGGSPDDPTGSDLRLTPVAGGYLLEVVTDKGGALLKVRPLEAATPEQRDEAAAVVAKVLEGLEPGPDLSESPDWLQASFDDLELWKRVSEACISCGACTYNCPTCYCFNITDEASGLAGERLRSWDSCMFAHYTREASGHNPRPTKEYRYRNRVLHKFCYYPRLYGGQKGCTGCGRCIHLCPAGLDIREVLLRVKERGMENTGD
ncbi:4Fe-4S dicluster domain-containing protein [Desulfocurvus sp. DL9XJH121]